MGIVETLKKYFLPCHSTEFRHEKKCRLLAKERLNIAGKQLEETVLEVARGQSDAFNRTDKTSG